MNPSDFAGNFAPIRSEDDSELVVKGRLPVELSGVFYRNGSNPQFDGPEPRHWFLGDGMIHAFFLSGGRARYRNRWVRTPRWTAENDAGRALFSGFGGRRRRAPAPRATKAASPTQTWSGTAAASWPWKNSTARSSWTPTT